ncbi:hypothetical protein [Pseudoxanthomonas winnipegensis]|uniref:Uncharacterized protein n=1 Tax=Pseudoxanthomonas winnipegensis TaxID=2480810 RepID=A0A4Q8M6G7_9GAMM|nr:hypothetical protein [Pseudoxanthomonas winnipegensis]TAA45680.1 hypothetical protein EA655_05715 [Pseudoxanthomonas winnipegensis]
MSSDRDWVLVPRQPTPEMIRAGAGDVSLLTHKGAEACFQAMLAAVPSAPADAATLPASVVDDWRIKAAEWIEQKAVEQEQNNIQWPDHAAAYEAWRRRPDEYRNLAAAIRIATLTTKAAAPAPVADGTEANWQREEFGANCSRCGDGHFIGGSCVVCGSQEPAPAPGVDEPQSLDQRLAEMLIGIIGDIQNELGFSDAEKECSNGSLEIVEAIRQLKRDAQRPGLGAESTVTKVYLVATGETRSGEEMYTRHEDVPPQLCDFETLYTAPTVPQGDGRDAARWRVLMEHLVDATVLVQGVECEVDAGALPGQLDTVIAWRDASRLDAARNKDAAIAAQPGEVGNG